jgi:hypothetical protein
MARRFVEAAPAEKICGAEVERANHRTKNLEPSHFQTIEPATLWGRPTH